MPSQGFANVAGGSAVTIGTFDGVHLGHRDILSDLNECAERGGFAALVVTFTPHPLAVVNPAAAPKLLTPGLERLVALVAGGAPRHTVVVPFSSTLASLTAEQFVGLLVERYSMRELVIGYDHGLGRGRQGDADVLRNIGKRLGFSVRVVAARKDGHGVAISSSAIRRAVAYGDLGGARAMLGRLYFAHGLVIPGSSRGSRIGVPTINLVIPQEKLLPPDGVYAVRVSARKGVFGGMMNLGGRPTFGESERVPEIHMFDAMGDWYGDTVSVEFVARIRDTVRFGSVNELTDQLARDAASARKVLGATTAV